MRAAGLEVVADIMATEVQFSLIYNLTRFCKEIISSEHDYMYRLGLPYKSFQFQISKELEL